MNHRTVDGVFNEGARKYELQQRPFRKIDSSINEIHVISQCLSVTSSISFVRKIFSSIPE